MPAAHNNILDGLTTTETAMEGNEEESLFIFVNRR